MFILFLIIAFLILYGSLYPWDIVHRHLGANPFWILLHAWPTFWSANILRDAIVNVLLYVPLGLAGRLSFRRRAHSWEQYVIPVVAGVLLSASIEMAQLFDRTRMCSLLDLIDNTAGTVVGVILGGFAVAYLDRNWIRHVHERTAALTVAGLWTAWQIFPVLPLYKRAMLAAKIAAISQLHLSFTGAFVVMAGWLALARVLEELAPAALAPRILALCLFALPFKLTVHMRILTWSEIAGALGAVALWTFVLRRTARRTAIVACAVLAAIGVRELWPWDWLDIPLPFQWVPFAASLEGDSLTSLIVLMEKVYFYTAAVWITSRATRSLRASAAMTAGLLFACELMQTRLAGRTPEITDAAIAVMAAIALKLLDQHDRRYVTSLSRNSSG